MISQLQLHGGQQMPATRQKAVDLHSSFHPRFCLLPQHAFASVSTFSVPPSQFVFARSSACYLQQSCFKLPAHNMEHHLLVSGPAVHESIAQSCTCTRILQEIQVAGSRCTYQSSMQPERIHRKKRRDKPPCGLCHAQAILAALKPEAVSLIPRRQLHLKPCWLLLHGHPSPPNWLGRSGIRRLHWQRIQLPHTSDPC